MALRKTKIVGTLGPASSNATVLRDLIEAGLDVVRLNCSHSSHEQLEADVALIRSLSQTVDRPVGILLDLSGPKLRIGKLQGGEPVELVPGATLRIGPTLGPGNATRVSCTYAELARDMAPGQAILLDDGQLELEVTSIDGEDVVCRVVVGGLLHERKGLNLPATKLKMPPLTDKDRTDLAVGVALDVDFVALSFVETADDILNLKSAIRELGAEIPVVAKLERPQAIVNLEAIIKVTDAVMVARGDLGVEAGAHRVPLIQKRILREASRHAVLDITATQMLDSMIRNPRPTRAEASDVANAILDGTDAVMLSGETAVGKYPVEAVEMMARIAREVESGAESVGLAPEDIDLGDDPAARVARAACQVARGHKIIVLTGSGRTAIRIAAFGAEGDILALTPDVRTWRRLTLVRGVQPVLLDFEGSTDEILAAGERELVRRGLLEPGEEVVLVSGQFDSWGVTHLMKVFRVRESDFDSIVVRRFGTLTQPIVSLEDLDDEVAAGGNPDRAD